MAATQSAVWSCSLSVLGLTRLSLAGTLWAREKGPLRVVSHGPGGTWPRTCPIRPPGLRSVPGAAPGPSGSKPPPGSPFPSEDSGETQDRHRGRGSP